MAGIEIDMYFLDFTSFSFSEWMKWIFRCGGQYFDVFKRCGICV